ncbi:MAG TPA: hypothetical protein PKZ27_03185 [Rhodocyclaceae bacterium]|nr:hypothetical protein [Rhodocyclaceae bacterium]
MESFWTVAGLAFALNIAITLWSAARAQAKNESSTSALIERLVADEREKRAMQFYDAREFARSQAADAVGKADAAHTKIQDVELRMLQMFTNYPTKTDLRDLFSEKFRPVEDRLDVVYEALVQRGVRSAPPPGDKA